MFPPPHPPAPPTPDSPQSYPTLALPMGSLYMFLDNPSPSFPHYPPLPAPLVTVSLFFISMSLVLFCLFVLFVKDKEDISHQMSWSSLSSHITLVIFITTFISLSHVRTDLFTSSVSPSQFHNVKPHLSSLPECLWYLG